MSIPTPSFWKIRKVLILVIIIIYCFVIGLLKNAFGVTYADATCKMVTCRKGVEQLSEGQSVNAYPGWQVNSNGSLGPTGSLQTYVGGSYTWGSAISWYHNGSSWVSAGSIPNGQAWREFGECIDKGTSYNVPPTDPCCPEGQENVFGECVDKCPSGEERTSCGCKPVCPSGQRLSPSCDCIPYCPYTSGRTPGDILNPGGLCVAPPCSNNEITNEDGTCTPNCTTPGQLFDVTTGECFTPQPNCGPCETLSGGQCIPPDQCAAGFHRNFQTCQCDETPEETPDCPSGQFYHWGYKKCMPKVVCPAGQYHNGEKCVDKATPPEDPDPKVDPKNPPTPTPTRPDDPTQVGYTQNPDPATPRETDPWTAAVKDNVDKTNEILTGVRNDLGQAKTDLTWIQATMAAVNENIGKAITAIQSGISEISSRTENAISDGSASVLNGVRGMTETLGNAIKGLGTDLTGIKDGIGDANEEIKGISEGTYTQPGEKQPYAAPSHDFGGRTSEFLASVKASKIFSLPNELQKGIPEGGSPILRIETGDTFAGTVLIDFSEFSDGLLVLRTLCQIMGITLAIRIITLKR